MGDKITAALDSIPMWIKAVSMVGFPIIVSFYFMAKDVGLLQSPADAMATEIHQHIQNDTETIDLLRQICINTTPAGERSTCVRSVK